MGRRARRGGEREVEAKVEVEEEEEEEEERSGARVREIRKRVCSCEMEELGARGVRGARGANPVARSVDSDERETSHFAVYPAMNLEFLMDVDRAEREAAAAAVVLPAGGSFQ
ncbi:hypothetical protein K0M31_003857 [Melipona bicolor]|uniref:Uncharacterized protein n=1 Tax=Melipona bicolor TaxID=60889 RepID=A0AA40FXP3_9HYME|nr:hypothetical protein K0M31_003857 [Melipona bicolor]